MEDKLGPACHGLFAEFVGEDLIEVVRFELFVLLPIPHPDLGVDAVDVLFLLLAWLFLEGILFDALDAEDVVAHYSCLQIVKFICCGS